MTPTPPSPTRRSADPVGVALVVGGATSVQFGAAVAASLFPVAGVAGVVALRMGIGALVLLAVCRPRLRGLTRTQWAFAAAFGVALTGMNLLIYQAIDRIPLGVAITIEVLGPLVLSVVAGRRPTSWLWAVLALGGVVLLGRGGVGALDVVGVLFALGAAVLWACYILLSAQLGARFERTDGLAIAMGLGAVVALPFGALTAGAALLDPVLLGLGAVVALLSSALPYSLELMALRRLSTATFSVLASLGPVLATVAGFVVLGQALTVVQLGAIALVVAASAGAVLTSARPVRTPPVSPPSVRTPSGAAPAPHPS